MEDFGMDWNGSGSHDAFDRYMDREVMDAGAGSDSGSDDGCSSGSCPGGESSGDQSLKEQGEKKSADRSDLRGFEKLVIFFAIVFVGVMSAGFASSDNAVSLEWVGVWLFVAILAVIFRSGKK